MSRNATSPLNSLLTSRDLMTILKVSYQTVCTWTKAGKIPALRLPNGAYRYRRAEIDAMLATWSTR